MDSIAYKREKEAKKKILFVINTMGHAGAEMSLLELLEKLGSYECELFLYVLMGQGELIRRVPPYVHMLNKDFHAQPVLTKAGRRRLALTVFKAFFRNGGKLRKLRCIAESFISMMKRGRIQISKLFWRVVSDGSERFEEYFDLAVAWLEGGSAYYVADHVRAGKKCAFIHTDYGNVGYTRQMDRGCWKSFDKIFTVSDEVRNRFGGFYPEYRHKLFVFQNVINQEAIRRRASESGGFTDDYQGVRLLTVGRLVYQKGYDVAVEAMKLLKDAGYAVRWYALGEGEARRSLEKKIAGFGLSEDFFLMGAVDNPYPYYVQADIYVHATRVEGKSIALQEAQTLGCAIVASDCGGNRELVCDGTDGILCALSAEAIAESIAGLLKDREKAEALGRMAKRKRASQGQELWMLLELLV